MKTIDEIKNGIPRVRKYGDYGFTDIDINNLICAVHDICDKLKEHEDLLSDIKSIRKALQEKTYHDETIQSLHK